MDSNRGVLQRQSLLALLANEEMLLHSAGFRFGKPAQCVELNGFCADVAVVHGSLIVTRKQAQSKSRAL